MKPGSPEYLSVFVPKEAEAGTVAIKVEHARGTEVIEVARQPASIAVNLVLNGRIAAVSFDAKKKPTPSTGSSRISIR